MQPYKTCCGCCSLRTCAIIIASSGLILTLGMSIFIMVGLSELSGIEDRNASEKAGKNYVYAMLVAGLIILLLSSVISMVLLAGAIKRNKTMLMIWLVIQGISLGLGAVLSLIQVVLGDFSRGSQNVLGSAIGFLVWWVVFSFHKELKEGAQGVE